MSEYDPYLAISLFGHPLPGIAKKSFPGLTIFKMFWSLLAGVCALYEHALRQIYTLDTQITYPIILAKILMGHQNFGGNIIFPFGPPLAVTLWPVPNVFTLRKCLCWNVHAAIFFATMDPPIVPQFPVVPSQLPTHRSSPWTVSKKRCKFPSWVFRQRSSTNATSLSSRRPWEVQWELTTWTWLTPRG